MVIMKKGGIPICMLLILLFQFSGMAFSQDLPEKPVPPRLVNDLAGMLNNREADALENKLVSFNDSTSTQIAIVTVSDLNGYAIGDFAQRLGEKWGIGQKGFNNGVLIVVKPKTAMSRGEVFIAPGYGLEGVIPDIVCAGIVDNEILPSFRNGEYYKGLDKAVNVLMSLASGEFTAKQYGRKTKSSGIPAGVIFFTVILVFIFLGKSGRSNHKNLSTRGLPLWVLLSMMNSGRSNHSGSWGNFSGGGGGFGGFGGGSFGGGGAGGSW
jgi:uncharacterized protein